MISVTSDQLTLWLMTFFWPLTRLLALFSIAPILGAANVPVTVRIALAAAITFVISPVIGPMPNVEPGSFPGLLILAQQLVIGVAMGIAMRIVFNAVEMAGNFTGTQMGLGFASFYDPSAGGSTPVISQYLGMIATLIFLSVNGHLLMIQALIDSFTELPIGAAFAASGWRTLALWGGKIFFYGLLLSLPMMAALLITNIALGVLTRAAPQLNIFAVGFPLTLGIGFIVLILALPYFAPVLDALLQGGLQMMALLPKLSH